MYAWIYRSLPGPAPVRVVIMLAAALLILAACVQWIFPWAALLLEPDATLNQP